MPTSQRQIPRDLGGILIPATHFERRRDSTPNPKSLRVWDASECALLLIDYQDYVLDIIFAQDRRVIELNVRTLATMAGAFKVPVVLSTVGVEMGVGGPTRA
jgi:isochorismate hydrolase